MSKRTKVFLPPWIRWVMWPMLLLIWGFMTYLTLVAPTGEEDIGLIAWLFITAVLVLVAVMFWLLSSGRLPAYIIEREDGDKGQESDS